MMTPPHTLVALVVAWLTRSQSPYSPEGLTALTRLLNSRAADMLLAAVVIGMVLNTLAPPLNALPDKLDRVLIKLTSLEAHLGSCASVPNRLIVTHPKQMMP
jgi:hypothetical protein